MDNEFKEYDHVIWESDTYPKVCCLGKRKSDVFVDVEEGERISDKQLKHARHASGKEILDFYREKGAQL